MINKTETEQKLEERLKGALTADAYEKLVEYLDFRLAVARHKLEQVPTGWEDTLICKGRIDAYKMVLGALKK